MHNALFPFYTRYHSPIVSPRRRHFQIIPHSFLFISPLVSSFLSMTIHSIVFLCLRTVRFLGLLFSSLLLSGDIEVKPGPSNFTVCTLNTRSILHPLHSAALSGLVDLHKPDLVCLSETWIKPTTTSTELINCTPPGYTFISTPLNFTRNSSFTGGGTGILIREPFTQLPLSTPSFSSFESSFLALKFLHSNLLVFNIYHRPSSSTFSKPCSVFLDEFSSFFFQRPLLLMNF